MYRDADEMESFGAEAPIPTSRLKALLGHLGITSALRYMIKGFARPRWVEFKAIAEIFNGNWVISRHKGPVFRASISDAMTVAAWQAITSWSHRNQDKLQNFVHHLLPYERRTNSRSLG
jgi:hypothetical protein